MSTTTGARKPSESQKAKALWAMKAAWDRGEDNYDRARKDDLLGRTKTRLDLWEEHLKDPMVALAKALECLDNPYQGWHLVLQCVVASLCRRNGLQHRWCKDFAKEVGWGPVGMRLALPRPMGRGAFYVHQPAIGRTPENMGSGRSGWLSRKQCRSSPCVSAETWRVR